MGQGGSDKNFPHWLAERGTSCFNSIAKKRRGLAQTGHNFHLQPRRRSVKVSYSSTECICTVIIHKFSDIKTENPAPNKSADFITQFLVSAPEPNMDQGKVTCYISLFVSLAKLRGLHTVAQCKSSQLAVT